MHADVNLLMKTDYSVQTISQSLPIPVDAIPTITVASGRLVTVEYKVCIQVLVHPHAIYKPLTGGHSELGYMFVDTPILIDAAADAPTMRPPSYTLPEITVAEPAEEKKKKKLGMSSMFRRKSSNSSSHQQQQASAQSSSKSRSFRHTFSNFKPKSSRSSANLSSPQADSAASSVTSVSTTEDARTATSSLPSSVRQQSEEHKPSSTAANSEQPKPAGNIIFFDMFPDSDSEEELEAIKPDKRYSKVDSEQPRDTDNIQPSSSLEDSDDDDEDDGDLLRAMRKQEKLRRSQNTNGNLQRC